MPRPLTHRDILAMAERLGLRHHDFPLHPSSRDTYLECHAKRYAHLLNTIAALAAARAPAPLAALDIGPGFQTTLLHAAFPDLEIDTLGGGFVPDFVRRHHEFDLNDFHFAERDPGLAQYDLILFCEVIEHLYTMPETVLARLRPHLRPGGALIVQTPNAVQWRHRVRMTLGRNPYDRIIPSRMGHYREYTAFELRDIAAAAGFTTRSLELRNYFGLHKRRITTLIDCLLWPAPALRAGITAVLIPHTS
jgi:SAM-dependent methyltransferase